MSQKRPFGPFWPVISEAGWTSRKKIPLGIRLKSPRRSEIRSFLHKKSRVHQMQLTRIDDVELVTKMTHETQSFQVLSFESVRECGATAGPKWAHKCALHFAAAWGHRGTLVGELAARTGLRGDVEVAHPATFPGFLCVPRRPRAT